MLEDGRSVDRLSIVYSFKRLWPDYDRTKLVNGFLIEIDVRSLLLESGDHLPAICGSKVDSKLSELKTGFWSSCQVVINAKQSIAQCEIYGNLPMRRVSLESGGEINGKKASRKV